MLLPVFVSFKSIQNAFLTQPSPFEKTYISQVASNVSGTSASA